MRFSALLWLSVVCEAAQVLPPLKKGPEGGVAPTSRNGQSAADTSLIAARGKQPAARDSGIRGDGVAIALLLLLYTLQGIPMGLGASLPMLMQERRVGTMDQAIFSTVAYPFAFKLLWAPIVDSVYSAAVGRRKSWIVPLQAIIGVVMLRSTSLLNELLGPLSGGTTNVRGLTALFLCLYFLAATQDVAVDGLALSILSPRNRELGATCNAIGQTLGYFLAYAGFLSLNALGLVSLGSFMGVWGWVFLASTLCVALARGDDHAPLRRGNSFAALLSTYRQMWRVLQKPGVRSLAIVLLSCKLPLGWFESLLPLELQRKGVSKEKLALLNTIMLPVSMITQGYVSRFFSAAASTRGEGGRETKPLGVFLGAYIGRLLNGCLLLLLVLALSLLTRGEIPPWLYAVGVVASGSTAAATAAMFVSQMAFFNRVSDPAIGGTYMTMLNTFNNLAGQWANTLVLATKGAIEKLPNKPNGFYGVAGGSILLGVLWLYLMWGRVFALQELPQESWLASDAEADGADRAPRGGRRRG